MSEKMMENIHLRPVFIAATEFSGVWIKLLSNKSFSIETTCLFPQRAWPPPLFPLRQDGLPCQGSHNLLHGMGSSGGGSPGSDSPCTTASSAPSGHRTTNASNVKGPVYSGNQEGKGVNENKNKQIHALSSLEGQRKGSERGGREWVGGKQRGEGRETGRDRERSGESDQ